ncbi:uncharacterized [Tachysurus ichikawai]
MESVLRWRPGSEWKPGARQFYKIPWSAQALSIIQLGRPAVRDLRPNMSAGTWIMRDSTRVKTGLWGPLLFSNS